MNQEVIEIGSRLSNELTELSKGKFAYCFFDCDCHSGLAVFESGTKKELDRIPLACKEGKKEVVNTKRPNAIEIYNSLNEKMRG